jgi:hypothetical protein
VNYPITLEGFEGQAIDVQTAGFLTGPKVLINGQPAAKGPKRGQMILRRNDGRDVVAVWKPQFLGLDVPQLAVDGKAIQVAEPLPWYVWVWSALPIILIFIGGALGAMAGMVGFSINTSIFRSSWPGPAKFGLTAVVSVVTVIVYVMAVTLFLAAIGR